jgi:hypothetical protein
MLKKLGFFLVAFISCAVVYAQADSSHLRISLLTCGVGDEIWETFGHTGVRIIDSAHHTDVVYNYGTFNGFDKDFELKFMRGKLPYYLSIDQFPDFMEEYVEAKRQVQEQVLLLPGKQKEDIKAFLDDNALPENREYKYDFFFDNCATRIRDIFPKVFGDQFKFAQVLPPDSKLTYRQIINIYFYKTHWERVGINILLGSKIDAVMTNKDIMFLPDYLRDGLAGATVDGKRISTDPAIILPGGARTPAGPNYPLILMVILALLTVAGLSVPGLRILGKVMSSLLLLVTGLLGCLILVMWFGTDHQGCHDNYNLLWALPTNLILAFSQRRKGRYALIAIVLLLLSLVLHIARVQQLPLLELGPLLLALLYIYGAVYRRSKTEGDVRNAPNQ